MTKKLLVLALLAGGSMFAQTRFSFGVTVGNNRGYYVPAAPSCERPVYNSYGYNGYGYNTYSYGYATPRYEYRVWDRSRDHREHERWEHRDRDRDDRWRGRDDYRYSYGYRR
ncbi:MAG TPA: hypothetical protein VKE70_10350 [Candidatus Solibacter sp.]|nr:hypothetical protein [Candidatus Solibacter sp.]